MNPLKACATITAVLSFGVVAQASTYVAESFSYADNTALAANWNGTASVVGGLTFGSLSTSGNAVQLDNASISRVVAGVPFYTGMWTSFLVRQDTAIADSTWGDTNRVGTYFTDSAGANTKYQYTPLNARVWGNVNATCAAGTGGSDATPAMRLNVGQTYLVIGYIDHVGMGNWTSLSVSMWMYDQPAFASLLAAGGSAASLDSTAIAKAQAGASTWGFAGIDSGDLLNLGSTVGKATFDEYRSGTALSDVVVVPEPGVLAGAAMATSVMALRRRRRA